MDNISRRSLLVGAGLLSLSACGVRSNVQQGTILRAAPPYPSSLRPNPSAWEQLLSETPVGHHMDYAAFSSALDVANRTDWTSTGVVDGNRFTRQCRWFNDTMQAVNTQWVGEQGSGDHVGDYQLQRWFDKGVYYQLLRRSGDEWSAYDDANASTGFMLDCMDMQLGVNTGGIHAPDVVRVSGNRFEMRYGATVERVITTDSHGLIQTVQVTSPMAHEQRANWGRPTGLGWH